MVHLTDNAVQEITFRLTQTKVPFLRIHIKEGGCSGFEYNIFFDSPQKDDVHFQSQGISIIADRKSLSFIQGSEIDFDDGLDGTGFQINKNPNASHTCGCGKSFNPGLAQINPKLL